MLTLQVIRIMDHIWHTEGMDLRMTPYTCLATGPQVGVIEVVRDAKTVYQIQRKASRLAAIQVIFLPLVLLQLFEAPCLGYTPNF